GYVLHLFVHHAHFAVDGECDALPREEAALFHRGEIAPGGLPCADGEGAVDFGEAVDVVDAATHAGEGFDDGGGGRRAGHGDGDGLREALGRAGVVDERDEHDGRAVEVGDGVLLDQGP